MNCYQFKGCFTNDMHGVYACQHIHDVLHWYSNSLIIILTSKKNTPQLSLLAASALGHQHLLP